MSRRDELAEKVMLMMLEKEPGWLRDPKVLAARSYAVASAMIAETDKSSPRDTDSRS
jgi:hypothetical protein